MTVTADTAGYHGTAKDFGVHIYFECTVDEETGKSFKLECHDGNVAQVIYDDDECTTARTTL